MKTTEIELPDDVTIEVHGDHVTIEGPEGSVECTLSYPGVSIEAEDDVVVLRSERDRRKPVAALGTFESQLRNAVQGVTEGFEYRMKVVYSHFPMQVSVDDGEVEVRNFLGEKHPRRAEIRGDTTVRVEDDEVILTGPDKEDVGQTAASIEQLTYINEKDVRVFQDGIYITEKPEA